MAVSVEELEGELFLENEINGIGRVGCFDEFVKNG